MLYYDKDKIKEKLTTDMVFDIVYEFGGAPHETSFGFISATICHNIAGEGSHKLYYYENTKLFRCYTGCDSTFDIFELIQKIKKLNNNISDWSLYDSIRWIAERYNWAPTEEQNNNEEFIPDWTVFERYDKIKKNGIQKDEIILPTFDINILKKLSYPRIIDWEQEGINKEVMRHNLIGYYPGGGQITIPHFDINNRFIGLRGRAISTEEAELYGKYRPIKINNILYNHPLGLNLYGLNNSKKAISIVKKAIIVEGEKSVLKYASYFGEENNICVACCGSSISAYQVKLLLDLGVNEIILGLDKQFQKSGDEEFIHLTNNLKRFFTKYSSYVNITFLFDKMNLLGYKDSPLDCGKETFLKLYNSRFSL